MFSLPSQSRRVGDGARCWSSEAICSKLSASNNWNSILGKFARGSVKFKWWIYMKINDIVALYLHTSTGATRSWQILQVKSYRFDFFPRRPRNTISTSSAALFLLCFSAECLWASRRMNIKKEDDNEFLLFCFSAFLLRRRCSVKMLSLRVYFECSTSSREEIDGNEQCDVCGNSCSSDSTRQFPTKPWMKGNLANLNATRKIVFPALKLWRN